MIKMWSIVCGVGLVAAATHAATIAQWTFDSTDFATRVNGTTGTPIDATGSSTLTSIAPEVNNDTTVNALLSDVHSANTKFYQGNGNGSPKAFFNDHWSQGNYYEIDANLAKYNGVSISIDAAGSNTGPRDFQLQVSTDGTTFADVAGATYSVPNSNNFAATTTTDPSFTHAIDLSSFGSTIRAVRLVNSTTTSIAGAAVGTGGTNRIDNLTISGTANTPTPEPTSLGLLAVAGAMLRRRR